VLIVCNEDALRGLPSRERDCHGKLPSRKYPLISIVFITSTFRKLPTIFKGSLKTEHEFVLWHVVDPLLGNDGKMNNYKSRYWIVARKKQQKNGVF
jgi:hypothetical protein